MQTTPDKPEGGAAVALDQLIRRIAPGGPYHLTIKTPEGYGFQCDLDDVKDFNSAITLLAIAVAKPGGIAAEVRGVVEMVNSPNAEVRHGEKETHE